MLLPLEPDDVVVLVNEWGTAPRVEAGEAAQAYPPVSLVVPPDTVRFDDAALTGIADLLHPVFAAPSSAERVRLMDDLLARAGTTVRLALADDQVTAEWRPADRSDSLLVAALRTLHDMLVERGLDAIGTCDADACVDVWIDRPRGRPRRYCSDTCSGRARVTAFRRRRREERP
ncbi:CGNR zinc finger domain-containing protein [Mumia zhuanghuii]|uniref:CGNR zinc finger domain-containing protein n=2 Tax=Mumia TaxID=1546255 RepID=A0ABW1QMH6_9ACTN|nr:MULTISPECIES: CGNR zinc finger domain-containing protein [Mumia]KAA1419925.1 CGNR zinc finger domain-containing protein [Mumia zhuanghuii]